MALVLRRENVAPWLAKLASSRRVVAPSDVSGKVLFRQLESPEQVVLDYSNTVMSPKEWLFPQTESLLRVKREGHDVSEVLPTVDQTQQVLFGIRPCDAQALVVLDKVFLSDPVDSNYEARRANTTLIGIACLTPSAGCFCNSAGSAPDDSSNVDVMLYPCAEGYVVEALTEKGQAVVAEAKLEEMDTQKSVSTPPAKVSTEKLQETLWESFDDNLWSKFADRCLGCRACTYLCPTCYCFNVRDYEDKDGEINRLRGWDSCQAVGFYKLAGGHNPRPTKASRLRQRFYHKLLYIPDRFEVLGCVGCGRCVEACPVNIDIREVITKVVEEQEKAGVKSVSA